VSKQGGIADCSQSGGHGMPWLCLRLTIAGPLPPCSPRPPRCPSLLQFNRGTKRTWWASLNRLSDWTDAEVSPLRWGGRWEGEQAGIFRLNGPAVVPAEVASRAVHSTRSRLPSCSPCLMISWPVPLRATPAPCASASLCGLKLPCWLRSRPTSSHAAGQAPHPPDCKR